VAIRVHGQRLSAVPKTSQFAQSIIFAGKGSGDVVFRQGNSGCAC